jgi:fructoselysine-6-P-deglycase FrlB-like protein
MDPKAKEYLEALKHGVAQLPTIEKAVGELVAKGVDNVYLVGCGGSLAVMSPLKYILDVDSKLPVYEYNASEFLALKPAKFTSRSLVITSSYTGTTKETVAAAEYARSVGASIIAFVGKLDSPLGNLADHAFANDAVAGVTDSKLIMLYQIIFNLIRHTDRYPHYDGMMQALGRLPELLPAVKEAAEEKAARFARVFGGEEFFITTGAGICWGEAYSYGCCIFEEMQWIKAHPSHAGEFFHGTFEILTGTTPLLVLQGEDRTRPLLDRVLDFARKYTNKIELVDTRDYELKGVPDHLRGYLSPLVVSAVLSRYSDHLAAFRNHPLSTRRYMFKVDY